MLQNESKEIKKLRSENKILNDKLKQTEKQYHFFLEKSPVGIILIEEGKLVYSNPKFVEQLGYKTANDLIGKLVFDLVNPVFKDIAKKRMSEIVHSDREALPLEEQFIKEDGSFIDVLVLGKSISSTNKSLILGYIFDISELKKAAEINRNFKSLVENAPDAIYILDTEGKIITANGLAMSEIELSNIEEHNLSNFKSINPHINWVKLIHKLNSEETIELKCEIPSSDYSTINFYWRKFILLSKQAEQQKIICFSRNINNIKDFQELVNEQNTELKVNIEELESIKNKLLKKNSLLEEKNLKLEQLNKSLFESKENYHTIFNSTRDGIVILHPFSKKIKEANDSFFKLTGISKKELNTIFFDDLFIDNISLPEKENLKIGKSFFRVAVQNYLSIIKNKNGQQLWVSLYMKYIKINNETNLLCLIQNIDSLERSKMALKQSKAIFRELSELSKTAIFMFDRHKFKYANPATSIITGYSNFELLNMPFWAVVHPDMQEIIKSRGVKRIDGSDTPNKYQIKLLTKSGEVRWVDFTATKLQYHTETMALGNAVDITEIKKYEEKLIEARLQAEQADKLKSAFLANMSHEIRTPMNGVLGFVQLLKDEIGSERQKRFINIIESSAEQLLNLINDILDLSKIESGQTKLKFSEFDLVSLFNEMLEIFNVQIKNYNKNITLNLKLEFEEFIIFSDKKFITQILTNLLGNAFKFTDQGEINFGFTLNTNIVKIFVSDTGIGIPQEKQKLVFDRFTQIHSEIKTQLHGTGLGLSITKKLVDLLKGNIYLKSEVNIGTTFFVELPLKTKKKYKAYRLTQTGFCPCLSFLKLLELFNNHFLINKLIFCTQTNIINSFCQGL